MTKDNVKAWPKATGRPQPLPKEIKRPCYYLLDLKWIDLETQLGTIEGYNRLVKKCLEVRAQIERGEIKAQNPLYAKSIRGDR